MRLNLGDIVIINVDPIFNPESMTQDGYEIYYDYELNGYRYSKFTKVKTIQGLIDMLQVLKGKEAPATEYTTHGNGD